MVRLSCSASINRKLNMAALLGIGKEVLEYAYVSQASP